MLRPKSTDVATVRGRQPKPGPWPGALAKSPLQPLTDALRSAIADRGLSPYELAKAAGVDDQTISQFVRHEVNPKLATAVKLFKFLGLKVVRRSKDIHDNLPQSPADALRSAIADDPRSVHALARAAKANEHTINQFGGGKVGLRLTTADKLANEVGVKLMRESKDPNESPPQTIADALRSAIADDPRSIYALARTAEVVDNTLYLFMGFCKDLMISTADKIANVLPVKVVREVRRHEPKPLISDPSQPSMDELRAAIAGRGLSAYTLATRSGVSTQTISDLLKGRGNLKYATAIKLANALGFEPEPAEIPARPDAPPPPAVGPTSAPRGPATTGADSIARVAGPCPLELRASGSFPLLGRDEVSIILTWAEYEVLAVLVAGWGRSRWFDYQELARLSKVAAPRKVIERMSEKPGYRPIVAMIERSGSRPQLIRLTNTSPT